MIEILSAISLIIDIACPTAEPRSSASTEALVAIDSVSCALSRFF